MKIKEMQTLAYHYGDEDKIKLALYQSKEPILIKISNFTDQFSLSYFEKQLGLQTQYDNFENQQSVSRHNADFAMVISQIKQNMPYRIFGTIFSRTRDGGIRKSCSALENNSF